VRNKKVLPPDLLKEVQKYIQGEYLYIPWFKKEVGRKVWGKTRNLCKKQTDTV
jgi:hypothetical protein